MRDIEGVAITALALAGAFLLVVLAIEILKRGAWQ